MDFGIAIFSSAHSWKVVKRAEELGFSHAWFYDSQLLAADVYAVMALAAQATSRIKLGTGVAIPSNRISPITASALATLNALAPGRILFGVGTGFTGRRAMGLNAVKLADMEAYVDEVYALLRGETIPIPIEGQQPKARLLHPDRGLINTLDPIPLHMSALGPKARDCCARMQAGWITFAGNEHMANTDLAAMQASWSNGGHAADALYSTVFTLGRVLEPGEPYDSPKALAQGGPLAAIVFHNLVEADERGSIINVDPSWAPIVERYKALYRRYQPSDARYLELHRGHLIYLRDDERELITADAVKHLSMTGTVAQLREKIRALEAAGYSQLAIQIVQDHEDAVEDWARVIEGL
ncbi:MAG: LLM class flavin-dependent oxidoreductase [Geminicoccaceae bacterium]